MNRVKVSLGLSILVLLWIGNLIYFQRHQLEEPLFMKHYYNIQTLGDRVSFELYYLVNPKDDVRIRAIHIPAYNIHSYPDWDHERGRSTHYKVKSAHWEWNQELLASVEEETTITEIEVEFANGERQQVDIGEIIIRREAADQPFLHAQSTGGSSDHTGFALFRENQPLQLIGLKHLPPRLDPQVLTFEVNGQRVNGEITPGQFDPQSYIEVKYAFQFPKNDPRAYHVFGSSTVLEVQTEDGEVKQGLMFINYTPHWSREEIREIVRERRIE